jgi:hypothetical protein
MITDVIYCHNVHLRLIDADPDCEIELLDAFLKDIGMEIAIPKAVEDECCGGKKTLDALFLRRALDESRIKVRGVRNRKLVTKLEEDFNMGKGESEAIALALARKGASGGHWRQEWNERLQTGWNSVHHGDRHSGAKL